MYCSFIDRLEPTCDRNALRSAQHTFHQQSYRICAAFCCKWKESSLSLSRGLLQVYFLHILTSLPCSNPPRLIFAQFAILRADVTHALRSTVRRGVPATHCDADWPEPPGGQHRRPYMNSGDRPARRGARMRHGGWQLAGGAAAPSTPKSAPGSLFSSPIGRRL